MRATLTLDGCAYEGDTSPAPGLFTIEVRNQTPYGANFVLYELADDLEGTSQLPGNERTGRYVILCEVIRKRGTSQTSDQAFPLHAYAAVELDVGPTAN